jgi:acetyl-CoA C-acetyltransferase
VSGSVIVAGARTPIGRLLGSLKDFTAAQLGGVAIKAALEPAPARSPHGRPRSRRASRWTCPR